MRGCFTSAELQTAPHHVLPAYAGMFRKPHIHLRIIGRSPRVCGDVSRRFRQNAGSQPFSPRMRGCFHSPASMAGSTLVLPAYAGMFPSLAAEMCALACSPRVCGDVSRSHQDERRPRGFSPRMRGCFHRTARGLYKKLVLPAYAGMFLSRRRHHYLLASSPRVCGDVSV